MKALKIGGGLLALAVLLFVLGPRPEAPALEVRLPAVTAQLQALQDSIKRAEAAIPELKPGNEARIVWADSVPRRTSWCVLYLPGFTATYMEGEPIHREFAARYGCNLYVPRYRDHGLEVKDKLLHYHPDSVLETAAHALSVARQLGDSVLVMSTSTGGTLSLLLAAQAPEKVDAIMAFSPNIAIKAANAKLLTLPWGLQMARQMVGGAHRSFEAEAEFKKYWYNRYRLEALVQLQNMLDHGMQPKTFEAIRQPFFLGYYYKNEQEQDQVVSVPAMLHMFEQISTPEKLKRKVAFPNAGNHAIASRITAQNLDEVRREIFDFAESVLGWAPVSEVVGQAHDEQYDERAHEQPKEYAE